MKHKFLLFIVTGLLIFSASCIKKDPLARITQVLMVPLSPDANAVDFKINETILATSVAYSSTTGTATYTLPYYTITPGSTTSVAYTITGSSSAYASGSFETLEDNAYSTFLIDSANKTKVAIVNDDLELPSPGKVKVRFLHFAPNAPAIDVAVGATGALLWRNRTFNDQAVTKSNEEFIEVDPGVYTFKFLNTGTSTVAYTTTTINMLSDRIYTIAARGFVGGATNKALGAWVYPNRP